MTEPRYLTAIRSSRYARELASWSLLAVAFGALEGGVLGVMLKGMFAGAVGGRALNYSVALLLGAPHFCNLLSFLWVRLVDHPPARDRRRVARLLFRLQLASALCLLPVAAAPADARGLAMMVAAAVAARLCWSGVVTLRAPIWRRRYPREMRARFTGAFFAVHSLTLALTGLAVGALLDWRGSAYPWIYAAAAAFGVGGTLLFRGLRDADPVTPPACAEASPEAEAAGALGFAGLAAVGAPPAGMTVAGSRVRRFGLRALAAALLVGFGVRALAAGTPGGPEMPAEPTVEARQGGGYLVYCPCTGRFGNQVSQLLGSMATARDTGRTLVLPPFIDYRRGETIFIPFEERFSLAAVNRFVPAVTLEQFLAEPAMSPSGDQGGETAWPVAERRLYCARRGQADTCAEPRGNPQKTFWQRHGVEFVGSVAVAAPNRAAVARALPADRHPVVALAGAPASFPVRPENRHLQRYLVWNDEIRERGDAFLAEKVPRPYLAVHLRNGSDWQQACRLEKHGAIGRPQLWASPQCGLDGASGSTITEAICLPGPEEAVRAIRRAAERFGPFRSVFIGTDHDPYLVAIEAGVPEGVRVVRGDSLTLDLYAFAQADLMIANCVSTFSALAVRERRAAGRPSVFFGFEQWSEANSYLGEAIAFDEETSR